MGGHKSAILDYPEKCGFPLYFFLSSKRASFISLGYSPPPYFGLPYSFIKSLSSPHGSLPAMRLNPMPALNGTAFSLLSSIFFPCQQLGIFTACLPRSFSCKLGSNCLCVKKDYSCWPFQLSAPALSLHKTSLGRSKYSYAHPLATHHHSSCCP